MVDRLQTAVATALPERVAVGGGTALFVDGRCLLDGRPPGSLELLAGDETVPVMGWGAPPPRTVRGDDYWWAVLPIARIEAPARLELGLRASVAPSERGGSVEAPIGGLDLVPALEPVVDEDQLAAALAAARESAREGEPLVAVCMATFEPDPGLLERQLESIRGQTHGNWICLISDDGSSARSLEGIRAAIAAEPRFVLSQAPVNRGFYANFERALTMVPSAADLVALCDQDDEWRPDKLERLLTGLDPEALLVYSDMRIVEPGGRVVSDTYWQYRRNNHTDFSSLMLANTVTGAASLFRRELLDVALPFPPRHARAYHDHWIAQVAMAQGPISYVDEPLYDYVQHDAAAIGHLEANAEGRFSGPLAERARITWGRFRDRGYHLGWRQPYFNVYCRLVIAAAVLRARLGDRMSADRSAVVETLLDRRRAAPWLLRRVLRDGLTTTETLGRERVLLAGLAWRSFVGTRSRIQRRLSRAA